MIWATDDIAPTWPLKPLSDVTSKVGSGATPRGGRSAYPDHGVPLIRSQNVHFAGFSEQGLAFLTDVQARHLDNVTVNKDDVLLNITGASIGRVCLAPSEMEGARVNQHVCIIRSTQVRPEFLASYLASPQVQDAIVQGNYGVTREALTKAQVLELPVPVPSDSEQDALASLIDKLSDNRNKALAHLKVARQALASFLPAVLAAAHVEACLSDDGGTEVPLAELLREPLKNGYSAKPANHETPFRVLTLTATTSGWFDERHFKYTEEGFAADSPFWLSPGDIVVQRGNTAEYVGMPALYDGPTYEFLYPDLMIRVRVHSEIDPRFVWYMLLAPQTRKFLTDRATGSAGNMPKINQAILNKVPVPLPPLETRQRIVRELDRSVLLSNAIGKRLDVVTRGVERSSQAVLGKAFRGELRPARSNTEIITQLKNA